MEDKTNSGLMDTILEVTVEGVEKLIKKFIKIDPPETPLLTLKELIVWITEKGKTAQPSEVAFIIKSQQKDKSYKITCGIFDEVTGKIIDAKLYIARQIDKDLLDQDNLVVYK